MCKESWPLRPGFDITLKGYCLPFDNQLNNGMVVIWNVGDEKRMLTSFYLPIGIIHLKIDLILSNPVFQYSIIPIPHGV
jgi:hypothetical protein